MKLGVKGLIIRISIIIVLFIASIPIWFDKNNSLGLAMSNNYYNMDIFVEVDYFKSLIVIDDDRALACIEPTRVSLRNKNNFDKDVKLMFLISKSSTVDYQYIRVSLDDKIYDLCDLEMREDGDNYYFILESFTLNKYTTKDYQARIWINPSAGYLPSNTSITTNFIVK